MAQPSDSAKAAARQASRAEREAAALRENLRRRKQQTRARAAEAPASPAQPEPAAPDKCR